MDPFAEWPPAHYHYASEAEMADAEMAILNSEYVPFVSAGIIENGILVLKLPADYAAHYTGALAQYEMCEHGLSAWLCADPINHYPRDNSY